MTTWIFAFDQKDQLAGVNSLSVTEILKEKYGLKTGNQEQVLKEGIHVYPDGILCNPSPQSRSIHLFTGTWLEGKKFLEARPGHLFEITYPQSKNCENLLPALQTLIF
jgi:hypothetical protein